MKRGFGIGLLLLASSLLLVTLGVTLTVPGNVSFLGSLEIIILLLVQLAVILLLFADKKWGIAHLLIFLIAVLGAVFSIRAYLSGAGNLEILAIIALDLLGFLMAIFGATESEPKVPRRQLKLDRFDTYSDSDGAQTIIYEAEKDAEAEREAAIEIIRNATKKAAKTTKKKAVKKTAGKRGRPKGSKNKKKAAKKVSAKKTAKKTSSKKVAKKAAKKTTKKSSKKTITKEVKKKETPKKTILVEKTIETHF